MTDKLAKHADLANSIKAALVYENASIHEATSHSAYNASLPAKWTPEDVKELAEHNRNFSDATHVALGDFASEIFAKDKDVTVLESKVGIFDPSSSVNVTVYREKEFAGVRRAGEAAKPPVVKQLHMVTDVEIGFAGTDGLKRLKSQISERFSGAFSGN